MIVKNYVKGSTKACNLRNSIVDGHCNNISLKKLAVNLAFSAVTINLLSIWWMSYVTI